MVCNEADDADFGDVNVAVASEVQPEVKPDTETAGATADESGAAVEPMPSAKDAKTLQAVPGIAYPSIPFRDSLSWPVWVLVAVHIMDSAVPMLLLGTESHSLGPPPMAMAPESVPEQRLAVFSIFYSVYSVYLTYGTGGVTSLRIVAVYYLLSLVVVAPGVWFMADCTVGLVLLLMLNPLWSFRFMRQPCFAILFAWVFCVIMWLFWQFLAQFSSIKAAMPNDFLKGFSAPLVAGAIDSIVAPILIPAMLCLCRPGIPPFIVYIMQFVIMLPGDIVRLFSLATTSGRIVDLASNLFLGVLGDLVFRTRLLLRAINRFRQTPLLIDPLTDNFLRVRFTMTYYPIIPLVGWTALAAIGGSPWASDPWHWVGIFLYSAGAFVCDSVMVLAHRRWHPMPGESFLGTLSRLAAEPRAHWPSLQPTTPIPQDLWAESCVAVRCGKYLTDADLSTFLLMNVCIGYVYGCIWAQYGLCGWVVNMDHCPSL